MDVKFRYRIKQSGKITTLIFTLEEIETGAMLDILTLYPTPKILSRDLYIGRKDKNNIEIFSGDVVRWINCFGDENIGWVRYTEAIGGFYIVLIKGSSLPFYTGQERNFEWSELEIIDNIHVNPELLKEAKIE